MKKYKQYSISKNLYRRADWFINEAHRAKRPDYTATEGVSHLLLMAANLRDSSYNASKLTAIAMLETMAVEVARAQTVAVVAARKCALLTRPKKMKRKRIAYGHC